MESIRNVLIVDDDDDDAFIIEDRLRELTGGRCRCTIESDLDALVEALSSNSFDLCLLDYFLGAFTGIDVLNAISSKSVRTPIILLAGQSDDLIAKRVISMGAQDYISKSEIDSHAFAKSISYAVSRKALEISRLKNQQIKSENLAKDRFISHLSHELRTPLTSILGYTDLLIENPITAPVFKELKIIEKNGRHLLSLLNDVLDLSKLLADKFELHLQPCDLRRLLVDVYSLLSVAASDKGIRLIFQSESRIATAVYLDETRFKQVLLNILGNAIKFTDKGEVRLTIDQTANPDKLHIMVSDTGIGMEQEKLKDIFKPFSQLADVSTRRAGGAGLGLSISSEIVQRMKGTIEVSSEKGKGSTFHIDIPINLAEGNEQAEVDFTLDYSSTEKKKIPSLKGKVLIVDDIFEIRQLVGQLLKIVGTKVSFAKNGQQAVELVGDEHFDLIIMDLQMPVMTGQEALKEIRQHQVNTPIVAMTAGGTQSIQHELTNLGFNGLISKPIDSDVLYRVAKKYLPTRCDADVNNILPEKVVLIEDDEDARTILSMIIKNMDYDVSAFGSAADAFVALKDIEDGEVIILSDLNLPDCSGKELLQALRNFHPHSPLYVISGEQANLQYITEFGIEEFIVKPVTKEKLSNILEAQPV